MLKDLLLRHSGVFAPLFDFPLQPPHTLALDFSANNPDLRLFDVSDQSLLQAYIGQKLHTAGARAGIGGYGEHRILYRDKALFGQERFVHLGVDIWLPVGTAVRLPLGGKVHGFAYNEGRGNYGATIIMAHQLEGVVFYSLYGHLSLQSLKSLSEEKEIKAGEVFANIGDLEENGGWAPHLHFQLIADIRGCKGDFIGVTSLADKEKDLENCPDPMLVLC